MMWRRKSIFGSWQPFIWMFFRLNVINQHKIRLYILSRFCCPKKYRHVSVIALGLNGASRTLFWRAAPAHVLHVNFSSQHFKKDFVDLY